MSQCATSFNSLLRTMWRESAAVLLLGAATTACYHGAADGGVDASESGDATRADGTSDDGDDGPVPGDGAGPMPLRRLSRVGGMRLMRHLADRASIRLRV